jgi:hypothetical protein
MDCKLTCVNSALVLAILLHPQNHRSLFLKDLRFVNVTVCHRDLFFV